MKEATHWSPIRFRKLTDEQVGSIQHRLIDLQERAKDVAAEFGISSALIYRVKSAVPKELVTVDEVRRVRQRQLRSAKRRRKVS